MQNIQYSYETVGNLSCLVATFPGGKGLINYQLQMLINNNIKNILKVNKRQRNEDIVISYNITSTVPLSEIIRKHKITKDGLINIIEGVIAATNDLEEYQLVGSGIVFDEQYIFVKPGKYEPNFVYLPCSMDDNCIEQLKKFLLSLIMGSKVEMTNDNFVQVLLETLNNPKLKLGDLHKLCSSYKSGGENSREEPRQPDKPQIQNMTPPQMPPQQPIPNPVFQPHAQLKATSPTNIQVNRPNYYPNHNVAPNKVKESGAAKGQGTKMIIFGALQTVFVGIIAALILSGVLNDKSGAINIQYVGAVALLVGCADFILFREMFINSKNVPKKENQTAVKQTNPAMPKTNMPPVTKSIPQVPATGKAATATPKQPPMPKAQSFNANNVQQANPTPFRSAMPVQSSAPAAQPSSAWQPPQSTQPVSQAYNVPLSDFESEDTVVLDDTNSGNAYLEYYENGLATRIPLNKEYVVVGKLRGQCNFVFNNNKISKVHAEFITKEVKYFVKDYNSTNGTYINGSRQRIQSNIEYEIFNGDRITLANVDLTFKC